MTIMLYCVRSFYSGDIVSDLKILETKQFNCEKGIGEYSAYQVLFNILF